MKSSTLGDRLIQRHPTPGEKRRLCKRNSISCRMAALVCTTRGNSEL